MGRTTRPAVDRVLEKCVELDECLIFAGCLNPDGYGLIMTGSRTDGTRKLRSAHIVVWEAQNGPVSEGLELDHTCRRRACVRIDHLEAVTHRLNCKRGDHSHLARPRPWMVGHPRYQKVSA